MLDIPNNLIKQLMLKKQLHILRCIDQMKMVQNMQGKESSTFWKGIMAYLMTKRKAYYVEAQAQQNTWKYLCFWSSK